MTHFVRTSRSGRQFVIRLDDGRATAVRIYDDLVLQEIAVGIGRRVIVKTGFIETPVAVMSGESSDGAFGALFALIVRVEVAEVPPPEWD